MSLVVCWARMHVTITNLIINFVTKLDQNGIRSRIDNFFSKKAGGNRLGVCVPIETCESVAESGRSREGRLKVGKALAGMDGRKVDPSELWI